MSDYDEIRRSYRAIVRGAIPNIDYFAYYRAQVAAQASDGSTVDVIPDDTRLPHCSGIALRLGLPGVTVTVEPGCYVMLGWDGGNPARPYATLWDLGGTMIKLNIEATTSVNVTVGACTFDMNGMSGIMTLNGGKFPIARANCGDTAGASPIVGGNPFILG